MERHKYGEGRDGWLLTPAEFPVGSRVKAIAINCYIPWWSLVAARMEVNLIANWLPTPSLDEFVRSCFTKFPVRVGASSKLNELRDDLRGVEVALWEEHPRSLEIARLFWTSPSLKLIVCVERPKFKAPKGWLRWEHAVKHHMLGGVTDANCGLVCYSRTKGIVEWLARDGVNSIELFPQQDLRCVLKAGQPGFPITPEADGIMANYQSNVRWVQKGIVSAAGLLPMNASLGDLQVKTILGGSTWVIRPLLGREITSAFDVPENIGQHPSAPTASRLTSVMKVPIKGFQAAADVVKKCGPLLDLKGKKQSLEEAATSNGMSGRSTKVIRLTLMDVPPCQAPQDKPQDRYITPSNSFRHDMNTAADL